MASQSPARQAANKDGAAVLIPRIDNRDEYEAFPEYDSVRRIIDEELEEDGKLAYTTKFEDGHIEKVGARFMIQK